MCSEYEFAELKDFRRLASGGLELDRLANLELRSKNWGSLEFNNLYIVRYGSATSRVPVGCCCQQQQSKAKPTNTLPPTRPQR